MREILFRGKRIDNGEWIEGFYAHSGDEIFILFDNDILIGYVSMKEVIPETVGQFTGLTDKNGKKIFEGDILKYCQQDGARLNGKTIMCIGKVVYNNKTLSYAVEGKDEMGSKNYDYFPLKKEFEVIGNIYDNSELLGD